MTETELPKVPAKRGRKPKTSIMNHTDGDTGIIPPCPQGDPMKGMKDPAVVEWWFTYHPAQAAVMYEDLTYSLTGEEPVES